ncbi:MAG: penicillin-binding protein activator [Colwellia sp.]
MDLLLVSQTNFFITLLRIVLVTFLVVSCSSQSPVTKTTQVTEEVNDTKHSSASTITATQKLASAKSLLTSATTSQESSKTLLSLPLFVEASELFLQEQNYTKALWLADKTQLLSSDAALNYRLLMVKAASLHALNYNEQAFLQLQSAEKISRVSAKNSKASTKRINLTFDYYVLLSEVLHNKARPIAKLNADLHAFYLNNTADENDITLLWQKLTLLSQWQLEQLAKQKPPFIEGWLQLLKYSHQFGNNQPQFNRYLRLWQRRHPTHPAIGIAQQLQKANLTLHSITNIAIILPLSGKQEAAGLAAQQGVLAAYKNNDSKHLHFLDSSKIEWKNINEILAAKKIDYVIGPLLRSNVEAYLTVSKNADNELTDEIKAELSTSLPTPTLLLNLPQTLSLPKHISALSMRPEDEANQAATTLSKKNYQHPIILSHQDNVSKRIASAFSKQWQVMTGKTADIIYFKKGKLMQENLKTSLDVTASQARIKELKSRLKQNIKAESRNRRDIDMIYVVGSAKQTRLVKPYIDVNTSPFASLIPVYASSRSHSVKNDTGDNRDLQGLTFTEIPWLLHSSQQNKALAKLNHQLWPKRSDSLSSIFAMGYDSYHLINKIPLMQQASYIHHAGQTGTLKLNEDNILTRSLIWGRYQNDKVINIVMD